MTVLLMRHGEPHWNVVAGDEWRGAANDLAPLTPLGEEQVATAVHLLRSEPPVLVLSSPMTRALHTAAIVAASLSVPLEVHMDLREWLPDESYQWTSVQEVTTAYEEMLLNNGVRPSSGESRWEPLAEVRDRALGVLAPHLSTASLVLVVCHGVLIHALTGEQRTAHAQLRLLATDGRVCAGSQVGL